MTGHARQDGIDLRPQPLAAARVPQIIDDVAQKRLRVDFAQERRRFADRDSTGTEGLDDEAQRRKRRCMVQKKGRVDLLQVHDLGDQQRLGGDPGFLALALQALIDQPFMRRMLIDDDDAGFGLGDDVILVHLRARRA